MAPSSSFVFYFRFICCFTSCSTTRVILRRVLLQVEETSAYCTVNHRALASNHKLSNMKRPAQDSNRRPQRLKARTLTAIPLSPLVKLWKFSSRGDVDRYLGTNPQYMDVAPAQKWQPMIRCGWPHHDLDYLDFIFCFTSCSTAKVILQQVVYGWRNQNIIVGQDSAL